MGRRKQETLLMTKSEVIPLSIMNVKECWEEGSVELGPYLGQRWPIFILSRPTIREIVRGK